MSTSTNKEPIKMTKEEFLENFTQVSTDEFGLFEFEPELHEMIFQFTTSKNILVHRVAISLAREIGNIIAAYKFPKKYKKQIIKSVFKIIDMHSNILDDVPS